MNPLLKAAYNFCFEKLPVPARKLLGYLEFKFDDAPTVRQGSAASPRGRLGRGAVTFSIDFEMSWAWQYSREKGEDYVTKGLREREQVPDLISQFERYHIAATWATVGHLFLTRCSRGAHGLAHPEMPRLQPFESKWWRFPGGDWYQHDPCSDVKRDPAWYAPDLIERILSSSVGHEVACHSFSHAGFGPYCPEEVAGAELDACIDAMAQFGVKPSTIVFPGNEMGHFPLLAKKGIHIFRLPQEPALNVSLPYQRSDSLWAVPASVNIDSRPRWMPHLRLARLKGLVDLAAHSGSAAHVWFHPSMPKDEMESILYPLLAYCAEKRDAGVLDVLTMAQVTEATLRSAATALPDTSGAPESRTPDAHSRA